MIGYSFKRARHSIKHLRNEEQFEKQQSEIIELIDQTITQTRIFRFIFWRRESLWINSEFALCMAT